MIDDPVGFVYWAYPWGEEDTELADELGPDDWQLETLHDIGEGLKVGSYRHATVSGHGVGKSALVSWIIQWFMSTRPHPQIPVTANTKSQLDTKTWRELAKWHKLMLHGSRFEWTATKFYHKEHPATWFASSIPWSKDRPEAFAGTHAAHVALLFDEASAIPDVIYDTAEGAMTSPGSLWVTFGNGTRNTGRFKETFPGGRFAQRWATKNVDSRTAKMADQKQIGQWIEDYGIDSDFARVRVLGQFPHQAAEQFIGQDLIDLAQGRTQAYAPWASKILGVDIARFGDDATVMLLRQGPDIQELITIRKRDTMYIASQVSRMLTMYSDIDMAFLDVVGLGAGVVDRLVQLGYGPRIMGINAGVEAIQPDRFFNKRAEMWSLTKDWLTEWGCLPDHRELCSELMSPEYGFDSKERIQLERSKDMKARNLCSPDHAVALTLTFAFPVVPKEAQRSTHRSQGRTGSGVGFNPLAR